MTTVAAIVARGKVQFTTAGLPDASFEARLLVAGILSLSSTEVFTSGDRILSKEESDRIEQAFLRRLKREPVHRILGSRDFHGMNLLLSKETLEPRPDTEVLVDTMLPLVGRLTEAKGEVRILDLGTGSGAILLALLKESPRSYGVGSDKSEDALSTAKENAKRLRLEDRFDTVLSDWFSEITGSFDIIVSNPPYIRTSIIPRLEPEVRDFDPLPALDGGPDGLSAYRNIAFDAPSFLRSDGFIGVEIGFDQKQAVTDIFSSTGFTLVEAKCDYGGNDRVLVFSRA